MSQNYYSEIYLHLTWHTKLSRPLLVGDVEALACKCLREKAEALGDIQIHEIGGIETHVHLAVSIEPTVTISEMVGALKGYASHEVNRRLGIAGKALEWQTRVWGSQFRRQGFAVGDGLYSKSAGASRPRRGA